MLKYYETDQMGIIHHSNYIRWFEEARIDYMNQNWFELIKKWKKRKLSFLLFYQLIVIIKK